MADAAPEQLGPVAGRQSRSLTTAEMMGSDVYSFALLLYELLHEQTAFGDLSAFLAAMRMATGDRPPLDLPAELSALERLIQSCWEVEPANRPSMAHACTLLHALLGPSGDAHVALDVPAAALVQAPLMDTEVSVV